MLLAISGLPASGALLAQNAAVRSAAPAASVTSGWYEAPFSVTLTAAGPGRVIRYTTDGSEPTADHGLPYTDPIRIERVTVLRAADFAAGAAPSLPVSRTYLFLDQLLDQPARPEGFPASWGRNPSFPGGNVIADYEMDSDPLRADPGNPKSPIDPGKLRRFRAGMRSLPVLSLVMDRQDLFGAAGLYPNAVRKDPPLEKPVAVEMILPDNSPAFSVQAGLRIHGNASRQAEKSPKHGFKLDFKSVYGETSLRYPLFPETKVAHFDDLVLRPDFGVSWLHWSNTGDESFGPWQRTRAVRFRDAWLKETFRAMGHEAEHNRFVHLFLNGLYWGLYDITEQPTANFAARTFGGSKDDYDVLDQGEVTDGDNRAYRALTSLTRLEQPEQYARVKELLDVTEFIDYTLLHFFVGHLDWGIDKNWYAIRRRVDGPAGRFVYLPWDGENILLNENDNVVRGSSNYGNYPSGLHSKLMANREYRMEFADRVFRQLLAEGAPLAREANVARWQRWQALLDEPIVAESVRWGDYRRDVHRFLTGAYDLYTREKHWLAENDRVVGSYFVHRPGIVLKQLRDAGLYPAIDAPRVEVARGSDPAGQTVRLSAGKGDIYYTLDGTDPRVPGSGAVSPQARRADGNPVAASGEMVLNMRALNGSVWSALNEVKLGAR